EGVMGERPQIALAPTREEGVMAERPRTALMPMQRALEALRAESDPSEDKQVEKWNELLDKIMRIQHPEASKMPDTVAPVIGGAGRLIFEVSEKKEEAPMREFAGSAEEARVLPVSDGNVFITLDDKQVVSDTLATNTIPAVVEEDQELTAGSTLVLRITEEETVNGVAIPRNTLIYGIVSLNGERMNVSIPSIRCGAAIYPVSLQVYDLDGLPGIRIPDGLGREVAKESAQQGIGSVGIGVIDPSLGAQAASAGIQAAKTFLGRKIRQVRVSVGAGYQVLLKNTRVQNH
ncbi:MAG: conjugative transposon protein TraM, partial [Bacteroidota bacterium]|nr:conjugative transposon protein TraM [Bacteroidota bacterium]